MEVLDVKREIVESGVDQFWSRFIDQLDVLEVNSAVVLRGVDQFCSTLK